MDRRNFLKLAALTAAGFFLHDERAADIYHGAERFDGRNYFARPAENLGV